MEVNTCLVFPFRTHIILRLRERSKRQQARSLTQPDREQGKSQLRQLSTQEHRLLERDSSFRSPEGNFDDEEKSSASHSILQSKYDVSFPSELHLQAQYRSSVFLSFLSFTDCLYYRFLTYTVLQSLVCAAGSNSSTGPILFSRTTFGAVIPNTRKCDRRTR